MADDGSEKTSKDEELSKDSTARPDSLNQQYNLNSELERAVEKGDTSRVSELIQAGAEVNNGRYFGRSPLFSAVYKNNVAIARLLIEAGAEVNLDATSRYFGRAPLFHAVYKNNEAMARLLIEAGADVNHKAKTFYGRTVLFYAVQNKNEMIVRLLIDAGANVNDIIVKDECRFGPRTVLDYSIMNNIESMVLLLIDVGADVNFTGISGQTPLFATVQSDNDEIRDMVQVLIAAGADVNITDKWGKTALFYAVQQSNNEIVVCALTDAGAYVNITDENGQTPLLNAVISCDSSAIFPVRALIDAGADVNCTDNQGRTPLHFCHRECPLAVYETLIQAGADVNMVDKTGQTALFNAVNEKNLGLVNALICAGIDVNICDHKNRTALFEIITDVQFFLQSGDKTEILAQIEEGADFIQTRLSMAYYYFYGVSISYYGAHSTFHDILQALVDAGADLNTTDSTVHHQTALSKAVTCVDYRSVCALIEAGADLEVKTILGKTVLSDALIWCYQGDFRFLDALIEAGADVNTQDNEGKTPLFEAVEHLSPTVVQRLIDAGANVNKMNNKGENVLFVIDLRSRTENTISDFNQIFDGLLKAGLDVNKVDNYGQTVLHWAALGDDQDIHLIHRLIEAEADTNIRDNRGYTALFRAVVFPLFFTSDLTKENETGVFLFPDKPVKDATLNIVQTLVEDGNTDVNARDNLGRTPLFYTIGKSIAISAYLIENGANLLIKDNCGVNVLSLFIENCMVTNDVDARVYPSLPCDMYIILDLFLQHGVTRNAVFEAIINVIFCKTLRAAFYVSVHSKRNEIKSLFNILKLASEYITKAQNTKKKRLKKKEIIDNILTMVQHESRDFQKFYECMVPNILPKLIELGANPNSADAHGNTALHFATCLPLYGLPQETVMKVCHQLDKFGVMFNVRNHKRETPLLFCLSPENQPAYWRNDNLVYKLRNLLNIFTFILQHSSSAVETTSSGHSVFHFLLELFQGTSAEEVGILLSFFDSMLCLKKDTINARENFDLASPLHHWATLKHIRNSNNVDEDTLKTTLNQLLKCGANLSIINKDGETPLHVCSSWTAVTLLLDAGADPCIVDSLGRPPLLARAEYVQRFLKENRLYFDVLVEPKEFWRSAIERGLDPWTVDKHGESVLSVLIKSDQFVLAQALVEVARDDKHLESETVAAALLNTICKDKSTHAHWKSNLAEIILKSIGGSIVRGENKETSPLHLCCLNIVENLDRNQVLKENSDKEVFWTIAKQLLLYGADGESCLDIAKTNPALKDLLRKPRDIKDVPLLIPWTAISKTSEDKLARVARRLESKHIEPYWYHNDHLASGSFGAVFAGINEKDGREVAIKRIEKRHIQRPEDKREITNLTALADCENIVRYLSFFEDENFCYVVLELMEGNLEDYLNCPYSVRDQAVELCGNVMSGLRYLHSQDILHRDLKPGNILYKCHPKLCLKIADFGLSRRIDSAATTVYGTNAGTRCWIAPEVLKSTKASEQHSKESDIFSCGLVLHYILSEKALPFAPADCTNKSEMQINNETEANIMNGKMEGWDNSLCPEAAHLLKAMLEGDESKRPSADGALGQPFFWAKEKKQDFLIAVGNQPEFECPRAKVTSLTAVENDLEASYGAIVTRGKWNDPGYAHMPAIHTEMMLKRKMPYDPLSTVELVRFIRNAIAHVSGSSRPAPIKKQLLEDFVFLEYFPNLVIEVYKAVTTHGWDQTREEIKYAMKRI